MEACYSEGSKIRSNSIPQIPVGQLAHQNCIRRDHIAAPTSDDPRKSFGLARVGGPPRPPLIQNNSALPQGLEAALRLG
jgi:hypothetical protein